MIYDIHAATNLSHEHPLQLKTPDFFTLLIFYSSQDKVQELFHLNLQTFLMLKHTGGLN
jgi:hypothetical protein